MPFENLLKNLVKNIDGALGAIMVAYDGESVAECIPPNSQMDRYAIQLMGAQMRALIGKFDRLHQNAGVRPASGLTFRLEDRNFFVHQLHDKYYVILAVRRGIGLVGAEHKLSRIAHLMNQQM